MREIEFRAWDKATKKMYEVIKIDFYNEKVGYLFADPITQGEAIGYFKFSDVELMQYTGLKDKNGVEIYEGDIVKDNEEKISYVAFLQQEMGYVLVYPKYDTRLGHRTRGSSYHMDCGLEVIGNIYDNPELMEE